MSTLELAAKKRQPTIDVEPSSELVKLDLIYRAVVEVGLPPSLQHKLIPGRPGRKPWNRFLLVSLVILGIQKGWSYREIERWAKRHLDALQKYQRCKKAPDHNTLWKIARKLKASDIARILATAREVNKD